MNNTQRDHIWRTTTVQPAPRRKLTPAQVRLLALTLAQQNEDRQKGKTRLKQATREARGNRWYRPPVTCDTCDDLEVVSRFRGGLTWSEPCPDCNGGQW